MKKLLINAVNENVSLEWEGLFFFFFFSEHAYIFARETILRLISKYRIKLDIFLNTFNRRQRLTYKSRSTKREIHDFARFSTRNRRANYERPPLRYYPGWPRLKISGRHCLPRAKLFAFRTCGLLDFLFRRNTGRVAILHNQFCEVRSRKTGQKTCSIEKVPLTRSTTPIVQYYTRAHSQPCLQR